MINIFNVNISRLKEYENNPRNNEIAVEKVAASIKRFGFLFPVIIDINYVIICGHTRKKACERLGITEIPCIKAEDLTPDQVDYFRVVDNRTSEYAKWNKTKLELALKSIDLDCERNNLIVKAFDLKLEQASLDMEVIEIKLNRHNFLGVPQNKKEINTDNNLINAPGNDNENNTNFSGDELDLKYQNENAEKNNEDLFSFLGGNPAITGNEIIQKPNGAAPQAVSIFQCGEIRFIISQVELGMLNEGYLFYMDNIYPAKTFIEFILENDND